MQQIDAVKPTPLTRSEFLARCSNAYDTGHAAPQNLEILARWVEIVARLQTGQLGMALDHLREEEQRTGGFGVSGANDTEGYRVVELAAILTHPCQECAVSPDAWWTRPGFCTHRDV